jgi:hypothetical protein
MTQTEILTQWQSQRIAAPTMSIEYFRYRSRDLERRTKRENAAMYVVAALFSGLFLWVALVIQKMWYAASLFCGIVFSAYFLKNLARPAVEPPFQSGLDALTFYRRELERQRDAKIHKSRWQIWVVGVLYLAAALSLQAMEFPKLSAQLLGPQIVFAVVYMGIAMVLQRKEITQLQREIDALNTLGADSQ